MSNKKIENIYDVSTYSDEELYNLLDLNNPTDRELEAKIIFMIKKYNNIQNDSGDKLANFFTDIYKHFFEIEEENEEYNNIFDNIIDNNTVEGFTNNPVTTTQQTTSSNPNSTNTKTTITNEIQDTDINTINNIKKTIQDQNDKNISFIKPLDYAPDKLNPLLNQTIKRIISIDSQYRDDKTTLSTEFNFNLSTPLKDVVSLKLYSVQIPYTWYTINKSYGSNFFYLKGNTPGILNNSNQFMKFDILPGNYSPQELVTTLNDSITNKSKTIYSDVSFGNTSLTYNSNTSLTTLNIDIKKQYNENSYYLKFEKFTTPNTNDLSRNISIPAFLGFNSQIYDFNILNSSIFPFYNTTNPSQNDINPSFTINSSNNYFTIIKYIENIDPNTKQINSYNIKSAIDISFNITLSLQIDKDYSRNEIFNDLNNQILKSNYLSKESYFQRINITDITNINYPNSIFQLKIKPNRFTTQNLSNSKIRIEFPDESKNSTNLIWTGTKSCFNFDLSTNEINNIIAETPAINQTNTYTITNKPKILLNCITNNFVSSLNDIEIILNNSPTNSPYTIDEYTNAINQGIINSTINTPFLKGSPDYIYVYNNNSLPQYTYSYIDNNDNFNLFLKINKIFDETMYRIDFTDSYLYRVLNIGNDFNGPITTNDTIPITGKINNNNLIILSENMPQVDLNEVEVKISFTNNGNIFGTSEYGPIYISKKDENYSKNYINNNWIINNNYYMYTVTETTYTIETNSFNIPDKKINIISDGINVTNNNGIFSINDNNINYKGNQLILPVNKINFDNNSYQITTMTNPITINANSWKIKSNNFKLDNNNWDISGNLFIANDTSWNIINNNFTLNNLNTINDIIELSGNSLKINNSNNFDISNGIINIKYNSQWNLNVIDFSLNNRIYTAITKNIISNTTIVNQLIINNTTGINNIYSTLYNTLNFYNLSVNVGNGLKITNNNNNLFFYVTYYNFDPYIYNFSINSNSIIINNDNITIIGNNITYNNSLYNYQNYSYLNESLNEGIINFSSNNDNINIKTTIKFSQDLIRNISIIGDFIISSNVNNSNFVTNFPSLNNIEKDLLYSSESFCVKNYDINSRLDISGNSLDVSCNNWKVNGNGFSIRYDNSWNITGKNIFVNDSSFQIVQNNINIESSKLFVNNISLNDNSFNIISNTFYTDSRNIIINRTNVITPRLYTSSRNYNIYSESYVKPSDTYFTDEEGNYKITSDTIFNINNGFILPNNNVSYLKGTSIYVNKDNTSGYNLTGQLTLSADTINMRDNITTEFTGKKYTMVQKSITIENTQDFSINVIYNKTYSSLTDLLSNSSLLSSYTIKPNEKILTLYPRFPNTINTFGNENDISYNIINNTGNQISCNSPNQLQQNINSLINNFLDINNENIFSGSKINLSLNNNNSQTTVDSTLNIYVKKQLKNKDYAISFIDDKNIINSWEKNLFIDISDSYPLINTKYNYSYLTTDLILNTVTIKGYKPIDTFIMDFVDNINNILTFVAYEDGTVSNNIQIKVPIYDETGKKIIYSRTVLINTLNSLLSQTLDFNNYYNAYGSYFKEIVKNNSIYVEFVSNINVIYNSKNYNIVFYDTISFIECYVGASSVRNTSWDTTIGWILGFRDYSEYNLSKYLQLDNTSQIIGDTGVSTNLFNYFLLCIDDFTQNHINDGLITITSTDKNIPLPSYANRTNFVCDPITKQLTYNNSTTTTDYSKLTQNQIYSITQVANTKNSTSSNLTKGISSKKFGVGPFVQDIFGIIPMKVNGLQNGSNYIEFGGTLQNQERVYFGPVNIHRMSIKLVTDRGDIIDLNNQNWSFSLLCEQLYKQNSSK